MVKAEGILEIPVAFHASVDTTTVQFSPYLESLAVFFFVLKFSVYNRRTTKYLIVYEKCYFFF